MAARREARYADPIRAGVGTDEYCGLYGQILAGLDPQRTYDELVALMAPAEPVLLCYEVPPFSAPQPIPQAGSHDDRTAELVPPPARRGLVPRNPRHRGR